jgi:hypothetical protein
MRPPFGLFHLNDYAGELASDSVHCNHNVKENPAKAHLGRWTRQVSKDGDSGNVNAGWATSLTDLEFGDTGDTNCRWKASS